ncbi:hypothetical protein C8R47DRAFT_1202253 [Mycena vitilis]|nr:hypothetical protein C8R47DRAFT_1202253 [Mycena vitilis]
MHSIDFSFLLATTAMHSSPFAVQELVDYIIDFLGDSGADLKTCALVCHSWLPAAQSHIFRTIRAMVAYNDPKRWSRVLDASPHLIRYIRRLDLCFTTDQGSASRVTKICNFPFTHLQWIGISYIGDLSAQNVRALQQLFSLATLKHVTFMSEDGKPVNLTKIFHRCTATIEHLDIGGGAFFPSFSAPQIPRSMARVSLTAIRIREIGTTILNGGLLAGLHPFAVSTLKALAVRGAPAVEWLSLSPAMSSLEVLNIDVATDHKDFDLSAFPQLSLLRISITPSLPLPDLERRALDLFSLLTRAPPSLRTLMLEIRNSGPQWILAVCTVFDEALSTVGLAVEIEFTRNEPHAAAQFSKLRAKNMVRTIPHNPKWWEETVLRM